MEEYLKTNQMTPNDDYILVHPGSGHSSLNWPLTRYRRLLTKLSQDPKSPTVIVSAGPGEENIAQGLIIDIPGKYRRFFRYPKLKSFREAY